MNQVATIQRPSLVNSMAARYDMEPAAFVGAIKASVIKGDCSNEQFAAFLMVAKEYDLNPLTKEIYAFPDRGGITPIVSIDGWMKLINSHPEFDGMEFEDNFGDDGKLSSVTCRIYRKDRNRPISVTEYMAECFRPTEPWKKWPSRMLRHKAAIQCARYAFGFSGIMEPDEYERMTDITPQAVSLADRMAAKRAEQTIAPEQTEGFDLGHVHTTTAQAMAEQPQAEPKHVQAETAEFTEIQEQDDQSFGAESSSRDDEPAGDRLPPDSPAGDFDHAENTTPKQIDEPSILADLQRCLNEAPDKAAVNEVIKEFTGDMGKLSDGGKATGREMIQTRRAELDGGV